MLNGVVEDQMANSVIAQLLFLESEEPDKDILLYINSPGGQVSAGLGIYNTMQFIKCDVSTVVIGQACSMGSFLAQAGAKGKRIVLPESRTMIHRVSSGTRGTSGTVHVQELQFEDALRSMEEAFKDNHNQHPYSIFPILPRERMDGSIWYYQSTTGNRCMGIASLLFD